MTKRRWEIARIRKTWQQKLDEAKAKHPAPRVFFCERSQQQLLIPAVAEVEQLVRGVRRGKVLTVGQITERLRATHAADRCCPLVTGIVLWLLAHAADEAERAGAARVVPWWRVVKADGSLNAKYPGQGDVQRARLEAEGHRVLRRGRKLVVDGVRRAG